jgi:peptidoglycan/LPS O-acetylase OafA/YrhL
VRKDGPTRLDYYASLDGLRGVALIAILFYHSGVNWISGGFLSVSTFFTLSGFLITSLLLYEWDGTGRIDLRAFWTRRLRRLMPGAILALLVVAIIGGTIGDASQVERLTSDGMAALFYVSNWRFIGLGTEYADLFASPSLVQHFWSLSIEEQFYLTYPILLIGVLGFGGRRALAAVLGLMAVASTLWMASLYQPDESTSRLYFGTDTRLAEILLGALLAIWHAGRPPLGGRAQRLLVGLGALGVGGTFIYWFLVSYDTPWLWQGGFAGYAVLTVSAIVGCVQPGGPARALLSAGPLPWLGRISYGVYLYHFPVYVTVTGHLVGLDPWPLFGLRIGLTFALAVVSYYGLERPVRLGRRLRGNMLWAGVPAGMAATALALQAAGIGEVRPADPSSELLETTGPAVVDDRLRVLVVGDSVADGLRRHLRRSQADFGIVTRTKGAKACGFVRSYRIRSRDATGIVDQTVGCSRLREEWDAALEQFDPSVVLLVEGWPGFGEKLIDGRWLSACDPQFGRAFSTDLTEAIGILGATGATVALTTAPPAMVRDVWSSLSESDQEVLAQATRASAACQDAVRRAVSASTNAAVIDLGARICPGGDCVREEDGVSLRPDGLHYSGPGGEIVARWLLSQIASLPLQTRSRH